MTKYENCNLVKFLDKDNLQDTIPLLQEKFAEQYPGAKLIYLTETGSVLHGTNSNLSDMDIKGLYIPNIESFVTNQKVKVLNLGKEKRSDIQEKNTNNDIDLEVYPVNDFLDSLSNKMETNAVEIIFSMFANKVLLETPDSIILKENYKSFLYSSTEALTRFAISQAIKYSVKGDRLNELDELIQFFKDFDFSRTQRSKLRLNDIETLNKAVANKVHICFTEIVNKEGVTEVYLQVLNRKMIMSSKVGYFMKFIDQIRDTYGARAEKAKNAKGVDFKAFAHAIRAIRQAKELTLTGFLNFPLYCADELKDIKYNNKYNIEELFSLMESEDLKLQELSNSSVLPDYPDFPKINEIKVSMYSDILNKANING